MLCCGQVSLSCKAWEPERTNLLELETAERGGCSKGVNDPDEWKQGLHCKQKKIVKRGGNKEVY